jgi:hypothetical protein
MNFKVESAYILRAVHLSNSLDEREIYHECARFCDGVCCVLAGDLPFEGEGFVPDVRAEGDAGVLPVRVGDV